MAKNYMAEARSDAVDTVRYFLDDVVSQLIEDGKASNDLFDDYPAGDEYHHENHIDKDYRLTEAAELLDQLEHCLETDHGLWSGQEPRDAISTQATYTYGNAISSLWNDLIGQINEDDEIQAIVTSEEVEEEDGEEDGPELPAIDPAAQLLKTQEPMTIDLALLVTHADDRGAVSVAADFAEENGSAWANDLRRGVHGEALAVAKDLLLRERINAILAAF